MRTKLQYIEVFKREIEIPFNTQYLLPREIPAEWKKLTVSPYLPFDENSEVKFFNVLLSVSTPEEKIVGVRYSFQGTVYTTNSLADLSHLCGISYREQMKGSAWGLRGNCSKFTGYCNGIIGDLTEISNMMPENVMASIDCFIDMSTIDESRITSWNSTFD